MKQKAHCSDKIEEMAKTYNAMQVPLHLLPLSSFHHAMGKEEKLGKEGMLITTQGKSVINSAKCKRRYGSC